jgi:hypothetical protein
LYQLPKIPLVASAQGTLKDSYAEVVKQSRRELQLLINGTPADVGELIKYHSIAWLQGSYDMSYMSG